MSDWATPGRKLGTEQADWEYGARTNMPDLTNPYLLPGEDGPRG